MRPVLGAIAALGAPLEYCQNFISGCLFREINYALIINKFDPLSVPNRPL